MNALNHLGVAAVMWLCFGLVAVLSVIASISLWQDKHKTAAVAVMIIILPACLYVIVDVVLSFRMFKI